MISGTFMYSQCPECDALYVLRAAELSAAGGMLRCGRCGVVFDALERLRDGTPASENLRLKSIAGEAPPPTLEPWQSTLSPLNDEVDDLFLQSRPQRPLQFTQEEEQAPEYDEDEYNQDEDEYDYDKDYEYEYDLDYN